MAYQRSGSRPRISQIKNKEKDQFISGKVLHINDEILAVFKDNQMIIEKSFPNRTETIQLDAPKGKVVLELTKDHSVRFAEASCTHKTCMTMGPISQAGQNLVCIPNRVAVTITGTNLTGVDSVTF